MSKTLTITASNRNRWQPGTDISDWFEKSIESQTNKDFEVLIADGGSDNYDELVRYCKERTGSVKFRIVQCKIGKPFERARLNNVGIRNSRTPYVLCTDMDIWFHRDLVKTILSCCNEKVFIEARTLYWKPQFANMVYNGSVDVMNNPDLARVGRIKKRTTAGGCQCAHRYIWNKVRGYNEDIIGWGSEDHDLLRRLRDAGVNIKWICEDRSNVMLFHQPHAKDSIKQDLVYQEKNKRILYENKDWTFVNLESWGGKPTKL